MFRTLGFLFFLCHISKRHLQAYAELFHIVADVKFKAVAINQLQAAAHIAQAHTPFLAGLAGVVAVSARKDQSVLLQRHVNIDKRRRFIANAVLKGIFNEDDEHQRRNLLVGHLVGHRRCNFHMASIAHTHQVRIFSHEHYFVLERHHRAAGLV